MDEHKYLEEDHKAYCAGLYFFSAFLFPQMSKKYVKERQQVDESQNTSNKLKGAPDSEFALEFVSVAIGG